MYKLMKILSALKLLGLTVLLITIVVNDAFAQRPSAACANYRELIVSLRAPGYGVPAVWNNSYKEDGFNYSFFSAVPSEQGEVIAYGQKRTEDEDSYAGTLLIKRNRRGRTLWKQDISADKAVSDRPVKLITLQSGALLALSEVDYGEGAQARVALFDLEADKIEKTKIITHDHFNYTVKDILERRAGGFMILLHASDKLETDEKHTVMVRLDKDLKEEWRRAYRVGIPNKVNAIKETQHGNVIAVGQIESASQSKAGWVLKISAFGNILWQRTYRKGLSAEFKDGVSFVPQSRESFPEFILTGVVEPTDKSERANWVMSIDSLGSPKWERYFRMDKYNLEGLEIERYKDSRIILFNNAIYVPETEIDIGYNHVRMLTLSPNGLLMQDEAYLEEEGVVGHDAMLGWSGERVIVGQALVDPNAVQFDEGAVRVMGLPEEETQTFGDRLNALIGQDFGKPRHNRTVTNPDDINNEGWILVGTALDPFEDPCQF